MDAGTTLAALPFPLAAEGDGGWAPHGDGLRLSAAARTDLFCDPSAAPPAGPGNPVRLLGEVHGDFLLSARVAVGFRATFDAGVLLVHLGERRWAKLCLEYTPDGEPSVVSVVTRGDSDDANAHLVPVPHAWLRVARRGRAFAFHASDDGASWRLVRQFSLGDLGPAEPVRAGFLAQSPTGEGCDAEFTGIRFRRHTLAALRDGS